MSPIADSVSNLIDVNSSMTELVGVMLVRLAPLLLLLGGRGNRVMEQALEEIVILLKLLAHLLIM